MFSGTESMFSNVYIFLKYSSKLSEFYIYDDLYINIGRRPNSHIISPVYCFLKSQT